MKQFKVRVKGRVQGVCFRYYTQLEAKKLGITGWVRNCVDGSVETLVCGEESQTKDMLSWLKHGPSSASVSAVDIEQTQLESIPNDFRITY